MSDYNYRRHNVNMMLYHLVCPTKFRKVVVDRKVDSLLKETCLHIQDRYDINFVQIGTDKNHVHFLIQSIPTFLPSRLVQTIKSITAREIFHQLPQLKTAMCGSQFWSDGYYIATVGMRGNERVIARYVKEQGRETEYQQLHQGQLTIFD